MGGVLCSCSLDNKVPSATSQGIQTLTIFGVHSEACQPGLGYASSQVSHTCPRTFVPPPLTPPPVWFLAWLTSQLTNLLWPWCGLLGKMRGMQTRRLVLRMSLRSHQSQNPAVDKSPRVFRVQLCSVFQEQCQWAPTWCRAWGDLGSAGQEKVTCSNLCLPGILSWRWLMAALGGTLIRSPVIPYWMWPSCRRQRFMQR